MADPRNDVRFDGAGYQAVTFKIDDSTITYDATEPNGSASVGLAVNLSTHSTVQLAGNGEGVIGKLIKVEPDGMATVQIGGAMTLPGGNGASLTPGTRIVGALNASAAKGYIKNASTEHTVSGGKILDASTATAVVVWF